ncbi:Uncharacterised protein [uncultured Comamonas sp.]|nr:Uncharacterised protein [uncultured Comamonas sp.]
MTTSTISPDRTDPLYPCARQPVLSHESLCAWLAGRSFPSSSLPVALLPIGPSALAFLTQLRENNIHLLVNEAPLWEQAWNKRGLLILLVQQECEEDTDAVLALAEQVRETGFGMHTLCVSLSPVAGADSVQQRRSENALQALRTHLDAVMRVPNTPEGTAEAVDWLQQVLEDMALLLRENTTSGFNIEDITSSLRDAGNAIWVSVQTSGLDKAEKIGAKMMAHPYLAGRDLSMVRNVLISVHSAPKFPSLRETRMVLDSLLKNISIDASVIFIAQNYASLGDTLRVNMLLTGSLDSLAER